jgi:predicted PurR-regulated permease PerM
MNNRTKQLAIVAIILFVIAIVLVVFFIREINLQSDKLSEQITTIETDRAQQTVFTRVQRTNIETQDTRKELQSYFLQSQSDSIDFLNFIEAQAAASGVELTTNTPTEVVTDSATYLSVGYEFTGSLNRVENFIQQLENIPYVSQLENLSLTQRSGNTWQAQVDIIVHVLNYET